MEFDDRQVRLEERHLAQNARAKSGVAPDLLEFVRRQRAGFTQDVIGDANLANVVEQRAQTNDVDFGLAERELARDEHRQRADPFRVACGVRIPRVERRGQRADGAEIGRLCFGLSSRGPLISSLNAVASASSSRLCRRLRASVRSRAPRSSSRYRRRPA